MFEGVSVADWIDLGASGFLVMAVALGLLIPRWTHNQRVADLKEQRDEWRDIARKLLGTSEVAVNAMERIKDEAAKP